MKAKRLGAKAIDLIIFIFLAGIFTGVFFAVMDLFMTNYDLLSEFTRVSTELSTMNAEAFNEYVNSHQQSFFMFMNFTFIAMFILGFIYFGIIGKFVKGSLGKYVLKLKVTSTEENSKVNMFVLAIREPFLQVQLISYCFFLISYIFPNIMLFNIFSFVYILMFFLDKDFWNKILKLRVTSL